MTNFLTECVCVCMCFAAIVVFLDTDYVQVLVDKFHLVDLHAV